LKHGVVLSVKVMKIQQFRIFVFTLYNTITLFRCPWSP